jgi:hypothetical protein
MQKRLERLDSQLVSSSFVMPNGNQVFSPSYERPFPPAPDVWMIPDWCGMILNGEPPSFFLTVSG